jgi:hypothetical protein
VRQQGLAVGPALEEHQPQPVVDIDRDAVLEAAGSARERATCSRLRRRNSSMVSRRAWMEPVTMIMEAVYSSTCIGERGERRGGHETPIAFTANVGFRPNCCCSRSAARGPMLGKKRSVVVASPSEDRGRCAFLKFFKRPGVRGQSLLPAPPRYAQCRLRRGKVSTAPWHDVAIAPHRGQTMATFAQHFQLAKSQAELDFVDVVLETGNPFFVDPFAISQRHDRWGQGAHLARQGLLSSDHRPAARWPSRRGALASAEPCRTQ